MQLSVWHIDADRRERVHPIDIENIIIPSWQSTLSRHDCVVKLGGRLKKAKGFLAPNFRTGAESDPISLPFGAISFADVHMLAVTLAVLAVN
jgi:hypothetical protein